MFKPNRQIYFYNDLNTKSSSRDIEEASQKLNQRTEAEKVVKSDINLKVDAQRKELEALSRSGIDPLNRWLDQESALKYKFELESDTDDRTKIQILQNLEARRHRYKTWEKNLALGNNVILDDGTRLETVFTLDPTRKFDSRTHYTEKFIGLSDSEQETWLKLILDNINQRKVQFNKLVGMVSRDFKSEELKLFQAQTREERENYLNLYTQHSKLVEQGKYHPLMKDRLKAVFAEQGIHGKKLEIARLREAISVSNLDDKFRDAPQKYQRLTEQEFVLLSNREKNKELARMRTEMRTEYQNLYRNKPHFTSQDIRDFDSFANSNAWSFDQGGWSFSQMQECIKQFSEAETTALECYEKGKKYSAEILRYHNWDRIGSWERKKILDSGKLEKQEHLKWDKQYKALLENYLPGKNHGKYGLLTKKSAKSYMEWFEKQDIEDKQHILEGEDDLQKTVEDRKKNNQNFEKLKPQYKKEYQKEYLKADFEERTEIIKTIESTEAELTKEFEDKVAKMIKNKTLAKKSGPEYLKWFEDLNISEKTKHLKASDLDDKNRIKILDSFKKDILPNLPKSKKSQIKKEFLEADLDERIELLTEYLKEYGKGKSIQDVLPPEAPKSPENITLDFLVKKAEQFASEGKITTAIDLYEDWLNKVKEFPQLATLEEVNHVKSEIKRLKEDNLEISENGEIPTQMQNLIEHHCDSLIMNDEVLKKEVKNLTVIQEIGDIMQRTELLYGKKRNVAEQMQSTIQDQQVRDLDELIKDESNGENAITQENGQYRIEKTKIFDATDFMQDENYREQWTENIAEEMIQKPSEQRTNRSIGAQIDGREVKAEEFKRREVEPVKKEIDQKIIERILASFAAKGYNAEQYRSVVETIISNRRHQVDIPPKRNRKEAA